MGWLARLDCRRVRRHRWQYLDGTLSDRRRASIEAHLTRCIGCRAEYARAACALESLQKGLPLEPDMLPARPRRWQVALLLTLTVLGLGSGLWLARVASDSVRPSPPAPLPTLQERGADASPRLSPQLSKTLFPSGGEGTGKGVKRTTTKPAARKKRTIQNATKPATPPEGTVEVYDESGQLIRRDHVRGTR